MFLIEVKHDVSHKTWKRLSGSAKAPEGLVKDLGAHIGQFATDNQMDAGLIAARVVEVDRNEPKTVIRVVHERQSDAAANKPAAPEAREGYHALDQWAKVYPSPTSVPFELKPNGGVFRGVGHLDKAKEYAEQVADFFAAKGVYKPVFVVAGPTSTTKSPFEVVDACAGYTILHRTAARVVPSEVAATDVDAATDAEEGAMDRPRG